MDYILDELELLNPNMTRDEIFAETVRLIRATEWGQDNKTEMVLPSCDFQDKVDEEYK
jgi:hypothetical protein